VAVVEALQEFWQMKAGRSDSDLRKVVFSLQSFKLLIFDLKKYYLTCQYFSLQSIAIGFYRQGALLIYESVPGSRFVSHTRNLIVCGPKNGQIATL
jgi:hypothetical protein